MYKVARNILPDGREVATAGIEFCLTNVPYCSCRSKEAGSGDSSLKSLTHHIQLCHHLLAALLIDKSQHPPVQVSEEAYFRILGI